MRPAFSVIFLTTLLGVGQGLFLAVFFSQVAVAMGMIAPQGALFYWLGSLLSVFFLGAGLLASFFHLGHPERAWRSAAMWRTSWLSREVIVLPLLMTAVALYGVLHYCGRHDDLLGIDAWLGLEHLGGISFITGLVGAVLCFALFVCTGMIYACLKFLQEWHTSLTPINYTLLGMASGYMLVTAFARYAVPDNLSYYADTAVVLTAAAFVFRLASLIRNSRLKPKSTLPSAIGVHHSNIRQVAQGAMGGSFNTREFFHGKKAELVKSIKWLFLFLTFPVPIGLLLLATAFDLPVVFWLAFGVQYVGLIAERWFFFAQANHPQNLYYQVI